MARPGWTCNPMGPGAAYVASVNWQRAPGVTHPARVGELDMSSVVRGDDDVVHLKTRVSVAAAQPWQFLVGTDEGVKLWVNGVTHS